MKKILIITLFVIFTSKILVAKECVVTMGYKIKSKPPYILNDNSGIYKDVYGKALKKIGCKLKIVRMPKLRIIEEMKKGKIDFYPTFRFKEDRAAFTYFIFSYIDHTNALVTRKDFPKVKSVLDLISHSPILLKEIGGASPLDGFPAPRFEDTDINIYKAMNLLLNKRVDAFSYPLKIVEFYLKNNPQVVDKVRVYKNFFPKNYKKHTFGFSLFSPYCKVDINKSFDPKKPLSIENFPTKLNKDSVAYKFSKMLEKMYKNGEIEKIYNSYRIKSKNGK